MATARKTLGIAGNVVFVAMLAVMLVIVGFMVKAKLDGGVPNVNGYMLYTVLSGSMEPEFSAGSLIAVVKAEPIGLKVGDVITFNNAEESDSRIITHRIEEIVDENGQRAFRTRGDANDVSDERLVKPDDVLGRQVIDIPYAGYLSEFSKTRQGLIIMVIIPALLIIIEEMRKLWKTASEYEHSETEVNSEGSIKDAPGEI